MRIVQNILYISQIPNFNGEHTDTLIWKTLEKSQIVKKLRKEFIFVYSKRHNLQRDTSFRGVYFLRLGMAIFRVILRDSAQILVKKTTIYKHDMTQFAFIFSTKIKYEEWRECDMKKNICYFLLRLL